LPHVAIITLSDTDKEAYTRFRLIIVIGAVHDLCIDWNWDDERSQGIVQEEIDRIGPIGRGDRASNGYGSLCHATKEYTTWLCVMRRVLSTSVVHIIACPAAEHGAR